MYLKLCLFSVFVALACTGCTSIRTTVLDRSENGHLSANPDMPLPGVPVMLKVPTHIDVEIVQVDYWVPHPVTGELELMKENNAEFPNRHIQTELVKTEQMFLVDPKRPGSGTGIYGFGFKNDDSANAGKGYLDSVTYKSIDKTFESSAALYSQIVKVLGVPTAGDANGDGQVDATEQDQKTLGESGIVSTQRTIAFRRFKLNTPHVDQDVQLFVDEYMNACHGSCFVGSPSYPN